MANADVWRERVAAWRASGLSAEEFARRSEGYAASTLSWWSWRLRSRSSGAGEFRVARVVVASEAKPQARPVDSGVMVMVGGVGVRVDRTFDADTLVEVVDALERRQERRRR